MRPPLRATLLVALVAGPLLAEKYNGPRPPKADVPFLLHADNLLETEAATAKQEDRKEFTAYVQDGASSPVRTPMAEPIFLLRAEKLAPQKLSLYRLESKAGRREILFPKPPKNRDKTPRPKRLKFEPLDEGLYRIEANETLENGEYCLTPSESNEVFCFEVY
jgi:hypothetical protein